MKVIIFAYSKESHAAPVKWALEQAGYEVACRGGLLWTEQQRASLITEPEGSSRPLEERMGLFPSFLDFITYFRGLSENQERIDIAAAVAASPFMSRETGRAE